MRWYWLNCFRRGAPAGRPASCCGPTAGRSPFRLRLSMESASPELLIRVAPVCPQLRGGDNRTLFTWLLTKRCTKGQVALRCPHQHQRASKPADRPNTSPTGGRFNTPTGRGLANIPYNEYHYLLVVRKQTIELVQILLQTSV